MSRKYDVTPGAYGVINFWHRGFYEEMDSLISPKCKPSPTITIGPYRIYKTYWERHGAKILRKVRWEALR